MGVITADINVEDFGRAVFKNEKYKSEYTTVIDSNGVVIYDTESLDNIGANLTEFIVDKDALAKINSGIAGSSGFTVDLTREDGSTETSYYYPIISGQTKWWSITALQKNDMNQSVTTITVILVAIAIAALTCTVVLLIYIIKKMLNPINTVVLAAEKIAEGNLDIQLEVQSRDEIGRLVEAFGTTIGNLQQIIEDIGYVLAALADGNFCIESNCPQSYVDFYFRLIYNV